jgi:hypothetical protein
MIFLRLLAFLAGAMILVVPPLVMSDMGTRNMAGWAVLRDLFALTMVASSYFFIALLAPRMRRSWLLRIIGGVWLLLPMVGGLSLLFTRREAPILYASGILIGSAVLLFIVFVFPATPDPRQRPMRQRDATEPRKPRLHQS